MHGLTGKVNARLIYQVFYRAFFVSGDTKILLKDVEPCNVILQHFLTMCSSASIDQNSGKPNVKGGCVEPTRRTSTEKCGRHRSPFMAGTTVASSCSTVG